MVFTVDAYTPAEVTALVGEAGMKKANLHPLKIFLSAVSAGCLLSFAPASAATATTSSWV
jgi:formate/nitrite transporter FocA (FNT family)